MPSFLSSLITLIALTSASSIALAEKIECVSNQALERAGWVVHAESQLSTHVKHAQSDMLHNAEDFIHDMSSRMMSHASHRPVQIDSYDRLSTPQDVMYGDILVVTDLKTNRVSELRWFDGKIKHVVYNSEFQECAMPMIPLAYNALF